MTAERILEIVLAETGVPSPFHPKAVAFLEAKGLSLHEGANDLVLFPIYQDYTNRGRLYTICECVIPGTATLSRVPAASEFGIHVRKTYVADAPPIRRGETPAVEFARTTRARSRLELRHAALIRPIGHEALVYRSRAIPGISVASRSVFKDHREVKAPEIVMSGEDLARMHGQITDLHRVVSNLHKGGLAHGDLHLENALWIGDVDGFVLPIDFAAAEFREDYTEAEWRELVFEDMREIYREALLMQLSIGRALPGAVFTEARKHAKIIFVDELADQVSLLRPIQVQPPSHLPTVRKGLPSPPGH